MKVIGDIMAQISVAKKDRQSCLPKKNTLTQKYKNTKKTCLKTRRDVDRSQGGARLVPGLVDDAGWRGPLFTLHHCPHPTPWQHKIKKIQIRKDTNDVKRQQQISKDENRSLPYTIAPLPSPLTTQKRIIKSRENVKRQQQEDKDYSLPYTIPLSLLLPLLRDNTNRKRY